MPTDNEWPAQPIATMERVCREAEKYLAPYVYHVERGGHSLFHLSPLVACAITLERTGGVDNLEAVLKASKNIDSISKEKREELASQLVPAYHAEERLKTEGWEFRKGKLHKDDSSKALMSYCIEELYDDFVSEFGFRKFKQRTGNKAANPKEYQELVVRVLKDYFPEITTENVRNIIWGHLAGKKQRK